MHELRWRIDASASFDRHDLLVVAVGYEERSSHVALSRGYRSDRKAALCFSDSHTLSFAKNMEQLRELGFEILPMGGDIGEQIGSLIEGLEVDSPQVGIDISSLTRLQLAQLVELFTLPRSRRVEVDLFYAPAKSESWDGEVGPITVAEPVHPAFTAWTDDPMRPLTAIVGVGVEDNFALGVAEFLDVSTVYAFVPTGGDAEFDVLNNAANYDFLETSYVTRRLSYDLRRPFDTFARLESLIYGIGTDTRIAVVPLGPKIFALCALLATAASERAATVWRFSSANSDAPSQRRASGQIVSLRLGLGPAA